MSNHDENKPNLLANALSTFSAAQAARRESLADAWVARPQVHSLYYNGKTVHVDGYTFVGCRFDNCILQVSSLNFEIRNCIIDASTSIQYSSKLAKVIQLFLGRYPWSKQHFPPYFLPITNPDGSETIVDRDA